MQENERSYLLSDDLGSKEWVGLVIDASDPELMGRCRVRVYGIFDTLPDEHLPWAFPATNNTFAGGEGGYAFISVPKVGTLVKIKFANGDRYSPQYTGIVNINPEVQSEIGDSYEGSHVLLFDVDEDMKIFYTPSKGLRITLKQSNITINPDTSIVIEHADSKSIIELNGSKISVASQETVIVTTQKAIVEATSIELGAGAVESLILGDSFKAIYDLHTHPGPNLPPIPLPSGVLSKVTKTL